MKRILLILSFILTFVLYGTSANNCTINPINSVTNIENVSKIKMYLPGNIKIYGEQDSSFIKINNEDSILLKNILYEFTDSTLNIKLKKGTYKDWAIDNKDLKFIIGVKSTAPEITVSNDLILSQYIKKDNNSKSNHETENN